MDLAAITSDRSRPMDFIYCKTAFTDILYADMRLIKRCRSLTPSSFRRYDTFLALGGQGYRNCHSCEQLTREDVVSMLAIC